MADLNAARVLNQPHTPMRFVNDEKLLNVNKRFCKDECEYFMRVPNTFIPDFMIVREAAPSTSLKNMELVNYETGIVEATMAEMLYADPITIINIGTKDYIMYRGLWVPDSCYTPNLKNKMTCGQKYFIRIDDYFNTWISEPFIACNPSFINTPEVFDGSNFTSLGANITWDNTTRTLCKTGTSGSQFATFQGYTNCAIASYYKIEFDIDPMALALGGIVRIYSGRDTTNVLEIDATSNPHVVLYDPYFYYIIELQDFEGCISNIVVSKHDFNICGSMRLEWRSDCDVLDMYNLRGHTNRFWFDADTELGEPEYRFIQEGHENGEKRFIADFKKRTKRFKIESELLPEHIIDALSDIPFFDSVKLYLQDDIGYELLEDIVTTEKWQFSGCYATMEFRFGVKDDGAETNCCANLEIPPCMTSLACRSDVIGDLDQFGTPDEGGIYFQYSDPNLIEYHAAGNVSIPCDTGVFYTIAGGGLFFYWDTGSLMWMRVTGDIVSVTKTGSQYDLSDFNVSVSAQIKNGLFGIIEYSVDGGTTWIPTSVVGYNQTQLASGISFDATAQQFKLRMHAYTINCDYGYSPEHDVLLILRAEVPYGANLISCSAGHAITDSYYSVVAKAAFNCDLTIGGHVDLDDEATLGTKITACFPALTYGIADDGMAELVTIDLYDDIFTAGVLWQITWVAILDTFAACSFGDAFQVYVIFT